MRAPWRERMIEDGVWHGPIVDQHIHLDRSNRYLDAVSDFARSGGTGLILVHKPAFSKALPIDINGYREAYSETISMAQEIRDSMNLDVGVALGPHPVSWEKQIHTLGLKESSELHLEAVGLALDFIQSGEANCLGEVGRPHYSVSDEIWESANSLLSEILSMAASSKSPVQLHVEDNGEQTCRELRQICRKSGLRPDHAVRHFAPADVSSEFTHGLSATVNVGSGTVGVLCETASSSNAPWGMESDFLDDPARPGAVLGPKTVPKRTKELCSSLLSKGWAESKVEDLLLNIHERWPKSIYGI
ncbi:MAG: hypothetical protein CMA00_000200 [Methanobacteriota archaeon]|nr:MAG: hypothetical protein CMA00_000200 [Euryarchaeota archaeon]